MVGFEKIVDETIGRALEAIAKTDKSLGQAKTEEILPLPYCCPEDLKTEYPDIKNYYN